MSKQAVVAIVGRTNVGKSSLFNALQKRRLAVVEDQPGVSRDRHYSTFKHGGFIFNVVDTGGLVGEEDFNQLSAAVKKQAELAIREADMVVAVFDGIDGVNPMDEQVVELLRRSGKPVVWVVNKCEKPMTGILASEFYELGINDSVCVSAAHRLGLNELGDAIAAKARELGFVENDHSDDEDAEKPEAPLRLAIVGKPNVGKSSIVNRILGSERLVVSDIPGTTRDSIDSAITRDGKKFLLVDTAGLRKKAKVHSGSVERYSNLRTLRSLVGCDVACLVLDATEGAPSEQDKTIAELIHQRGKALIIVVNKWDLVEKDHRTVKQYTDMLRTELPFVRYAPLLFVSALTGRRCPNILDKGLKVWEGAQRRIPTSDLNKMLDHAFRTNTPPVVRGEPIKLFFATQIAVNPPTVVLFLNYPKDLPVHYVRFLKTKIREHYDFEGSDMRFILKKRTRKSQDQIDRQGGELI